MEIEVSKVPKTKIILVSQSVIDRLSISHMLKDLHLIDNFVNRMTPDEAMEYLEELHNDSEVNDDVAVLILDLFVLKSKVKQVV